MTSAFVMLWKGSFVKEIRKVSRRQILAMGSASIAGTLLASTEANAGIAPSTADIGLLSHGNVSFPAWTAQTDPVADQPPQNLAVDDRVGFCIVGLGKLALEEILPAMNQSTKAKVVALVSGRPEKARAIAAQYGVARNAIYDYENFDKIKDDPRIEVVYIVLPNSLHREYVTRAAAAGKHVLCEKPMAVTSADCQAMIEACERAQRLLMIAYRCQYDVFHRYVIDCLKDARFGVLKIIEAANFQNMADAAQWRFRKSLAGGGSLYDVGIYCLNAARYLTREEPNEVFARRHSPAHDPRFVEVEETINFMLRFPSGVQVNATSSYGAHQMRSLSVHTEAASLTMDNAFAYVGQRLRITKREGALETATEILLEHKNQFALEIDHMAECVKTGRTPRTPGEEGMRDVRIMEAIYQSAASGKAVHLAPSAFNTTPSNTLEYAT